MEHKSKKMPVAEETPLWLTEKEACQRFNLSRSHLRSWAGSIAADLRIGRSVRYDRRRMDQEVERLRLSQHSNADQPEV